MAINKSCSRSCGPGDFRPGGKCDINGCYTLTDNPNMISFSGGRTSAFMADELLKDQRYRENSVVCFANTGLEAPETLDFVNRCAERWRDLYGVGLVWLEYCRDASEKPTFKIVDYATAARRGEPFADLLSVRIDLPNLVFRFCTGELKVKTIKRYMRSIGVDYWTNVVGIRYDEPRRWAKTQGIADKERFELSLPLVQWKTTKPDVLAYWRGMPFDLNLPHDLFGNCQLCFLKGKAKKKMILRKRPEAAEFWLEWERRRPGYTFYKQFSVAQLLDAVQRSPELFDDVEIDPDDDIQCFCNTD